jgi:dTDP-4-dehydrorhamnose 3,5-epimerase
MNVIETKIPGVLIIEPDVHGDHRGYFMETYSTKKYEAIGITTTFVQDNMSFSAQKGTLRGLHFQNAPMAQSKLVSCSRGTVIDVAVDIRKGSPTYKQWVAVELSAENKRQFFIPRGFAHGFVALEDNTIFQYKCDNYYHKEQEGSFKWDSIGIPWNNYINLNNIVLSEKDDKAPCFIDVFEDKLRAMSVMKKIGFNICNLKK